MHKYQPTVFLRCVRQNKDVRDILVGRWVMIDAAFAHYTTICIVTGQLEIVLGGWVMSDAAVTYYNDIIDQHTLGFDFLHHNLGPCAQSRVAWHVDQFGHSREHAAIFTKVSCPLCVGELPAHQPTSKPITHN